jgi:hypothetical protein
MRVSKSSASFAVINLFTLAGLAVGHAAAQSSTTLYPRCYFWEPPATAVPIRAEFSPIVRVVLNNGFTTGAYAAVDPGNTSTINLANGIGTNSYDAYKIIRKWQDPDNNPATTWSWIGTNRHAIFIQNTKSLINVPSSLFGREDIPTLMDDEKIDVDVDDNGFLDAPFSDTPVNQAIRRQQPWMYYGKDNAAQFWTAFTDELLSLQTNPTLHALPGLAIDNHPQMEHPYATGWEAPA